MFIKQLSVFIENRKGRLEQVLEVLKNENINIISKLQTGFQYIITDISGKEINKGSSKTNTISLSTENLPNGLYSVSIIAENNTINTKKILIQN